METKKNKPLAERPVRLITVDGTAVAFCDGEIAGEDRNIVLALRKRLAAIEEPTYEDFESTARAMCQRRGVALVIVGGDSNV